MVLKTEKCSGRMMKGYICIEGRAYTFVGLIMKTMSIIIIGYSEVT
jgi:formylmethanofuran dehydrogenase subunit C